MLEHLQIEIILALGLPAVSALVFAIRHFWLKEKCFHLMKMRQDAQEKITERGQKEHKEIFGRLNDLDKNMATLAGKMDILIKKMA